MNVEKTSFAENPQAIASPDYDCVWIHLGKRSDRALTHPALQWLDWTLQGQISRYLADGTSKKVVTFLPTMGRIGVTYLALDPESSTDWDGFFKNCEGLKLKRVLYVSEDAGKGGDIEKSIKGRGAAGFPEALVLGV